MNPTAMSQDALSSAKRKSKSNLGGFNTRILLSLSGHNGVYDAQTDGKSQHNDEDVDTHDSTATPHKRLLL
jgi:hypothetical protein